MSIKQSNKKCLVIINSHSTRSEQMLAQLDVLNDYFSTQNIERYELKKNDFSDPSTLQKKIALQPTQTLIIIIGGDGTVNLITHAAFAAGNIEHITLLPLEAGNASDLATILHGDKSADLSAILASGKRKQAYALQVSIGNQEPRHALAYVSFGASANVMNDLDGLSRRLRFLQLSYLRWLQLPLEVILGSVALLRSPRMKVKLNDSPVQSYYDIMFINGSRIAKLHTAPTDLTSPEFVSIIIEHKYPIALRHYFELARAHVTQETTDADQQLHFHKKVKVQIDGEVIKIPANTMVTIQKETQPYYVLSYVS